MWKPLSVSILFVSLVWILTPFRYIQQKPSIGTSFSARTLNRMGPRKSIHVCLRLLRQFSTVALPTANTNRCVYPVCVLKVFGSLTRLVLERQSVFPSNRGGWTSSNEFMTKRKTYQYCPMPWKL